MKYNDYLDERDEVTRPRRKVEKPKPKKASHKHQYDVPVSGYYSMAYKCAHCEKIKYGKT